MSEKMSADPREVISDFMLQGHLSYQVVGRVSDYECADAMIRDFAAEGVAIISAAKLATLQREADALREALSKAAETFRVYARLHRAKETAEGEEKARANDRHAEMCDAALNGSPQATDSEDNKL